MDKVCLHVGFNQCYDASLLSSLASTLRGSLTNQTTGYVHLVEQGEDVKVLEADFPLRFNSLEKGSIQIWLANSDDDLFISFRRGTVNDLRFFLDGYEPPIKGQICSTIIRFLLSDFEILDRVARVELYDDEDEAMDQLVLSIAVA